VAVVSTGFELNAPITFSSLCVPRKRKSAYDCNFDLPRSAAKTIRLAVRLSKLKGDLSKCSCKVPKTRSFGNSPLNVRAFNCSSNPRIISELKTAFWFLSNPASERSLSQSVAIKRNGLTYRHFNSRPFLNLRIRERCGGGRWRLLGDLFGCRLFGDFLG